MARGKPREKLPQKSHTEDLLDSWQEARPDLDLANFLQGIALMRLGRILDHWFDQMCQRDHGVSGADMRVLFALRRAGAPFERRPTDLFKAVLVASGTMTKQIDRLSSKGFVKRRPDANHSGGFLIGLTPEGKEVADYATNYLATKSLLLKGGEEMSNELKAAGGEYVFTLLKELERITQLGSDLPSR